MPTDAMTEMRERALDLVIALQRAGLSTEEHTDLALAELLAAERQGHRRGVADAAKVCEEHAAHFGSALGAAMVIRRRLGGEAT